MNSSKVALNIDDPVTLDELLDRNARETLAGGGEDLDVHLGILDRDGRLLVGVQPPAAVVATIPEYEPMAIEEAKVSYMVAPLLHEGAPVGVLVMWPRRANVALPQVTQHLIRVTDAFMLDGIKRAMSARMHMATVEEANRELTEKNRHLAQAVERLQEADRVKSNFLATVSHELRTPLTSVIGYSEMLLEGIAGELNDEQRDYVRTVMEKGDQLLQLITGILDISRMEAGEMRFESHAVDLEEVVSVALSTIAPHARRKRLSMACDVPPGLPAVLGDRDKVRQVLLNLLGNAVKFTPEGGKIEVLAKEAPLRRGEDDVTDVSSVHVAVRDSGIGIPAELQQRVFEPFFQVDNSSTREYGGTGLGLSIVKRLVEAQGGTVWLESEPGRGTTFWFCLPAAPESH